MKKTFDCVEMKRQCQQKLWDEYQSRKEAFSNFDEFLNAKAEETDLWKNFVNRAKSDASPRK